MEVLTDFDLIIVNHQQEDKGCHVQYALTVLRCLLIIVSVQPPFIFLTKALKSTQTGCEVVPPWYLSYTAVAVGQRVIYTY